MTVSANANSPRLPKAAPAASTPAAFRPRTVPCSPACSFFSLSCFSINVAPAGKMAGNARKIPPTTGPYFRAISPAPAVINPPATKRVTTSYHRVSCRPDRSISIRMAPGRRAYFSQTFHNTNATTPQIVSDDIATHEAANRARISVQLTQLAYTKNASAPAIMEFASVAAYALPSLAIVSPKVASAIDGAAPNNPAKLFGLNKSPRSANTETATPPIRNRININFIRRSGGKFISAGFSAGLIADFSSAFSRPAPALSSAGL